ncbi:2-keto-4-pentenoate hydratase/2-oxohepta-3-ene-1,7-dioic acid hydratase (catechol pathway) [Cyclobacterium xiamenense]|uniref:2-keto-4-pentenoate hydratase/2-oxohepta-3-ene-1,7-dioic acid hydratase (Catechol pathway) n=1 Tax=Cyclobacterium xiamenense TaxID=1297121 RepID=A0A1H6WUU8_9BACT|nr:fumarylacetoacetate hydrolase family protein [Cyclobacterium xiamenense]SEJ20629.1 2-keto-4-pentenoate hydratase/2-oxohepta-3-ene-1,7-dioic acid hydratase (catechol pathway) [Cyclobacterium xiamenense]
MKLIRFGKAGNEKPGIVTDSGKLLDCSAFGADWTAEFLGDPNRLEALKQWLAVNAASCPEIAPSERLGSPVPYPSKIMCVGLNYSLHAKESGMEVPKQPVLFMKATSALTGPFDPIKLPRNSKATDWEVELAIVIGKKASYVSEEDAMDHVFGYVLHNDVSERDFQLHHGGQWVKGKSCDTFAPLGPYLVSRDEIADPHQLRLWLKVNGETMQDSTTSDLVFNVPQLVSYISQYMSLLPGDIISTGTPAGVGMGLKPPRYLKAGDEVELGIDGLGVSRQRVEAP